MDHKASPELGKCAYPTPGIDVYNVYSGAEVNSAASLYDPSRSLVRPNFIGLIDW